MRVQKVAKELKNGEKPKRITVKSLGDSIGERALLERDLDKMPKTKAFVDQVCESEQDFRMRRVLHVVQEMRAREETVKVWKVLKKAGIRFEFYNEIQGFLHKYLG